MKVTLNKYRLQIYIIIIVNSVNILAKDKKDAVILKMDPEKIGDTFKSVIMSEYIQKLANEFAKKAASHLIREMKKKEKQFLNNGSSSSNFSSMVKAQDQDLILHPEVPELLNERDAFTLIKDPSPDGDNLELESKEFTDDFGKMTPVIEVQRINGVYYRRLLGLL